MKKIVLILLYTIGLYSGDTITLTGTLRDFNQDHPDFERHATWENGYYVMQNGFLNIYNFNDGVDDGLEKGNVLPELGLDGKPVVNPESTNNFKPIKLNEWYNDVDGVNMSMPYPIEFAEIAEGIYQFSSNAFFPADGKLLGNESYHGRSDEEYNHNFHMTYELHTKFTYRRGFNQVFNFVGDDDVWVFINNKLAIDLGGIHASETESINLDDAKDRLNLVDGETYNLDFFWAERHTTGSNFTITTSIELENKVITPLKIDVVSDFLNDGYDANQIIEVKDSDFTLDAVILDSNSTPIAYHPDTQSNPIPMTTLFYTKEQNSNNAPILIRDTHALFEESDISARSNTISADKISEGIHEIKVKYLNFYDSEKVKLINCSGSSLNSTLKGLPACVNGENNYHDMFGYAATEKCFSKGNHGSQVDLPCSSGYGSDDVEESYNHEYGCYECTIDALWGTEPNPTTAKIQKMPFLPVAEYRFDECSWDGTEGEVKDTQNSINATAKNGVTTQNRGVIKRSGLFNGENYVDAGDSFNDIFGEINDKFTITAWIKPTALTDKKTNHNTKNTFIAKASDKKNDNLEIGVNPDGSLHVYLDTKGKDKYADIGEGLTKNEWHFVAVSYDGDSLKVTIDENNFVDNSTWSGGGKIDQANGSPFTIGTSLHVDNFFQGGIDEVKIFDKVLDDREIENIYNSEKNGDGSSREDRVCPAQLLAEYHFDACEYYGIEDEVKDSVGANHGRSFNTRSTFDGKIERAVDFNDSKIEVEPNFALGSEPFAISFWMNPSSFPESEYMAVLSKEIEIYLKNDGKLSVDLKNDEDNLVSSSNINLNRWTHVALSCDGEKIKLYINGNENGSVDANSSGLNGTNSLIIGKTSWDEAEPFAGRFDELKIFDGALTNDKLNEIIADNGDSRDEIICLAPIGCKSEAVIIDDTKYVHEVDLATGDKITYTMNDKQIGGASINGFGYNIKDGYFWGSNQGKGGYLVRVGKDENGTYSQEKVGPIEGLPTNKSTYIGDIDINGHLYLYYKNTPSDGIHTMFVVNLDKNSTDYEYAKVIDSFKIDNINVADMAFNPVDNQLYAIESDNDFYKIDRENGTIKLLKKDVIDLKTDTYGSSFFDSSGFFYAIKNKNREIIRVMFREDENGTFVKASIFSSLVNENVQRVNIDGGRCNLYPILIDYGDAPDSYKTSLDEDGARHSISVDEPLVYFGQGVDNEPDAWIPDGDRDDGLVGDFGLLYTSNEDFSVTLKVKNNTSSIAKVVGWIDFNQNGEFEKKEGVIGMINPETQKDIKLQWHVPNDIQEGDTYARFRVTTDELTTDSEDAFGIKRDGEVEDYKIKIKQGNVYDAWGVNEGSIANPVIHTKIVNETIVLKTVSLDRNHTTPIAHAFTDVKAGLFAKDGAVVSNYQDINTTNPYDILYFEDIDKSYKNVYVKFQYKDDLNITHESNATDPFAIRPRSFVLTADKNSSQEFFRAGQDFNVTIKVEDMNGDFTTSYDENSSVYRVDYNETKESAGCLRGQMDFNKSDFTNGVANFTAKYSEVGELNFKVSEIDGKEFAIVDKDDGTGDARFIDEGINSEQIHPAGVNAMFTYKAINSKNHTYYSNNPVEMGVDFDVNVTVLNENNQAVKNFTAGCYPDDVNIRVNHNLNNVADIIFWDSNATIANITNQPTAFKYVIGEDRFVDGKSARELRINFKRDITAPKEPIKFTILDTNTSIWPSKISKVGSVNKTITFIYARAHAPMNQTVVGKTMNAKIDYEVYLPASVDKSLYGFGALSASEDSVGWYILPKDSAFGFKTGTAPYSRFTGMNVGSVDPYKISLTADKVPHNNRVVYEPKDYLLYNRWNSSASTDSFSTTFFNNSEQWEGKGAQGLTVGKEGLRRGNMKMDW